jgi:hypothetical protein
MAVLEKERIWAEVFLVARGEAERKGRSKSAKVGRERSPYELLALPRSLLIVHEMGHESSALLLALYHLSSIVYVPSCFYITHS